MTPAGSAVRFVASDADAFREAVYAWDLDFRPIERPRAESRLVQAARPSAILSSVKLGARVEQRGASPPGMRTFALLAGGVPEIVWCGASVDPDTLMSFDVGGDFEASSPAGFEVYTLSVPVEHLERLAGRLGVVSPGRLGRGARPIRLAPEQAAALRRGLGGLTRAVDREPAAAGSAGVGEMLEADLPAAILRAATFGTRPSPAPSAPLRERALRRALEFIDAHGAEGPTVGDLAVHVGASERTLRYAFQERFGMSPKSYLQAIRLNGVRRELVEPSSRSSVSDAANRWGFWHMGQFAADYRRLFGELPSQTLAARRG